jgi:LytS/YehU family sensor histidine kinase
VTILLAGTYYRHYQEEELKISRLKAERDQAQLQMTQAQLEALKMQLRPHFLFNTLNSISSLLDTNTKAAETMLARLGDFLRMTLDNSGTQEVTLEEEMKFLSCYLDIELERFSDRLTVQKEIARETYDALVPNLILQPIVENAIRHGIMSHVGDGRIEIRSRREDERLCLEVKDNGPGLHAGNGTGQRPKRGFGFALTRERLERLYGTRHSFSLSDAPEGGLRVLLEIPYHTSNAETNGGAALIEERITDV